jgi:hypothetical protein
MNIEQALEDFRARYCPYGSLDLIAALKAADEVGQDSDWVLDQVEEYAEQCGMKKDDMDVVYVVYDNILVSARGEIEELTGVDICDGINVYGNYLTTFFDVSEEFISQLKAAFEYKELDIHSDEYSLYTQFLLNNINI